MVAESAEVAKLLTRADDERAAGRGADAARLYAEAALTARADGHLETWARAALGAASVQVFGAEPGQLPPLLYDVLVRTTDEELRSRLAAALARCWVYAGRADRAAPFSDEAVRLARSVGDPALLADALDAALATHWGPDELGTRRALAAELDDVAAHVVDPAARLQAHLWGLHVACEALDIQRMHRQMRALEQLGEESPRARFFAASRRLMLDLLRGRPDTAPHLLSVAAAAAEESFIPDAWMVLGSMEAYTAVQTGDLDRLATIAATAEDFAVAEGASAVCAEAAYWWSVAGDADRARALVLGFHGDVLAALPRDLNWLLTLQCVLEAALAVEDEDVVEQATAHLMPYAGRAVVNGGAVMFHGTTDDTLSRAAAVLGRHDEAAGLRARALATYQRIGAQWWRDRLDAWVPAPPPTSGAATGEDLRGVHLHPTGAGLWLVGRQAVPVPDLRGLSYLRELVRRPGQSVPVLDLVGTRGPVVDEGGLGDVADRRALASYRQRLRELDDEIDEAEAWHDDGRLAAARAEHQALVDELARASGLGGRSRTPGSSRERARIAVRKAIATALDRVAAADDVLARHLRNTIHTGSTCSYEPEPDATPDWVLD